MNAAVNVRGVDFAVMPTRYFEAAVAFYGDTLGLRRSVYRPERSYAEFETGNLTLMEESGVAFTGDIMDSEVCYQAFFADPDGNTLILHHRYA